jgi:hypothetical protein
MANLNKAENLRNIRFCYASPVGFMNRRKWYPKNCAKWDNRKSVIMKTLLQPTNFNLNRAYALGKSFESVGNGETYRNVRQTIISHIKNLDFLSCTTFRVYNLIDICYQLPGG